MITSLRRAFLQIRPNIVPIHKLTSDHILKRNLFISSRQNTVKTSTDIYKRLNYDIKKQYIISSIRHLSNISLDKEEGNKQRNEEKNEDKNSERQSETVDKLIRLTVPLTVVGLGYYLTFNNQYKAINSVLDVTQEPIAGDDKDELSLDGVRTFPRWSRLFFIWLPILMLFPFWFILWKTYVAITDVELNDRSKKAPLFIRWWIILFVKGLEKSGVLSIKFGQWASTRIDLFHPLICSELEYLQSHVSPHAFDHSIKEINRMFDFIPNGIYIPAESERLQLRRIDEVPLGVGSIAQVHYAELTSGIPLAIKVTHPNIRENILSDLALVKQSISLLSLLPIKAFNDLSKEFSLFAKMMLAQVDLTTEAINLNDFRENFKPRNILSVQKGIPDKIVFPRPLRATEHLLAETFHNGTLLSSFIKFGPTSLDETFGKAGINGFLKMVFQDNFTHADLHPGNILIEFRKKSPAWYEYIINSFRSKGYLQTDAQILADLTKDLREAKTKKSFESALFKLTSNPNYEPYIVLIDAGLVNRLSLSSLHNTKKTIQAAFKFNSKEIVDRLLSQCRNKNDILNIQDIYTDVDKIVQDVIQVLPPGENTVLPLSIISKVNVISRLAGIISEHNIKVDEDLLGLLMTSICLEGIGRQICPDIDILKPTLACLKNN